MEVDDPDYGSEELDTVGEMGSNIAPMHQEDGMAVIEYSKRNHGAMGRDEVVNLLDSIDNRVEALRKEALKLQDERDHLLTRIDMLKNTDVLSNLSAEDKDEVYQQLKRINERLQTVDVNVLTVRDHSQVDSLNVINHLIDEVIRFGDPIGKRQKCQEYLAACSSTTTVTLLDKKFEGHLLGCTLDDQKRIKKRLEALLIYMAQQSILPHHAL